MTLVWPAVQWEDGWRHRAENKVNPSVPRTLVCHIKDGHRNCSTSCWHSARSFTIADHWDSEITLLMSWSILQKRKGGGGCRNGSSWCGIYSQTGGSSHWPTGWAIITDEVIHLLGIDKECDGTEYHSHTSKKQQNQSSNCIRGEKCLITVNNNIRPEAFAGDCWVCFCPSLCKNSVCQLLSCENQNTLN